ncbi:MAG: hypothetical protein N2111_10160 [Candidatus Sumerlaeaceae bacterium]|nr:hypothetical protein [Candidatus Sumerlaeaceae bacterium]
MMSNPTVVRRGLLARAGFLLTACLLAALPVAGATFAPPQVVTDGALKYQLSRTASHLAEFDASGSLHLVYWAGGQATNPSNPSFVFYRRWALGGWGTQVLADESSSGPVRLGGRHPSLALLPGGRVLLVWQDHRHCTASGNYIDNIEIYGEVRPAGNTAPQADIRLTTSAAPHSGDNGYAPKVTVTTGGEIHLAWYDFTADPTVSDIYVGRWTDGGPVPAAPSGATRATDASQRGGSPAFTVPDLAVDATGTRHLAWVGGTLAGGNLYYGAIPPDATTASVTLVAAGAADFFDPPHIAVSPGGDVWIAAGDETVTGGEDVRLWRLRAGHTAFDPPVTVAAHPARQFAPDIKPAADGRLHLAWIDERSGRHVYYGLFDPAASALVEERRVTQTAGNYERPALAIDPQGRVHLVFEDNRSALSGDIVHAAPEGSASARDGWNLYE